MYMNFNEFLEDKHPEYLDEGIGSWAGEKLGQGVDAMGRGVGRMASAAASGIGAGAKAGIRHAQNYNDAAPTREMAKMAQKAVMSGDPKQFSQVAKQIYKHMMQSQPQQSTNMPNQGQPSPQFQPQVQP